MQKPLNGYVVAFRYFLFSDFWDFLSQGGLLHMLNKQAWKFTFIGKSLMMDFSKNLIQL